MSHSSSVTDGDTRRTERRDKTGVHRDCRYHGPPSNASSDTYQQHVSSLMTASIERVVVSGGTVT